MEKRESVKKWSRNHRKQIIVAGVAMTAIAGVLIGLKRRNIMQEIRNSAVACDLKLRSDEIVAGTVLNVDYEIGKDASINIISKPDNRTISRNPFEVTGHVRNLTAGWHPSQEKIDFAQTQGIDLLENQTFVNTYTKGEKVA